MRKSMIGAAIAISFASTVPAIAGERIRLSSDQDDVVAELVDTTTTTTTRRLVQMLPLSIPMRDHLRQEKTGRLPEPLPAADRQLDFAAGTLSLRGAGDFVIYTRSGRVPSPGITMLGRVTGDVAIFDQAGPVIVRVERVQ